VLVAVYGLFALAATARSAVQIATKFHEAPLAYLLSAFAAVVYIVATVSLARGPVVAAPHPLTRTASGRHGTASAHRSSVCSHFLAAANLGDLKRK